METAVVLLITSVGVWWRLSCHFILKNWIPCAGPLTLLSFIAKPALERIKRNLSFSNTSSTALPYTMMSSIYCRCLGASPGSSAVCGSPWWTIGLCSHAWGSWFQVYWIPLRVKANCGLHCAARGIEKNALAVSVVAYHLVARIGVLACLVLQHLAAVWPHSVLDFCTGNMGLLNAEWVLLVSPWLSSDQINLWMGTRES